MKVPGRIVGLKMLAIPPPIRFGEAAMVEPLACVLRGLHEAGVEIGDSVAVIGGGPIGLMFVHVAQAVGCTVIAVVNGEARIEAARRMGAHDVVHIGSVKDPIDAVRALSPGNRGADVVVEAVGRPEAWAWATEMVRKGGTVNFFGGCAKGSKVELYTNRLHYSEITLKATCHHTPDSGRKPFSMSPSNKTRPPTYITA